MLNKKLNMIIKAAAASEKPAEIFFCIFILISTAVILICLSVIFPLWNNIDTKINHHFSKQVFKGSFGENVNEDYRKDTLKKFKSMSHITRIYRDCGQTDAYDLNGNFKDSVSVTYIYKGFVPKIIYGHLFKENETGTALIPAQLKDFDYDSGRLNIIDGKTLVGKTLKLDFDIEKTYDFKVVGVYDSTDPIYLEPGILIPIEDMRKIRKNLFSDEIKSKELTEDNSYIFNVDSIENAEAVKKEVDGYINTFPVGGSIDEDTYNTALVILIAGTAFLILLITVGAFMFLKNSVNSRTKELALYRATGYKTKHIFYILFAEKCILGLVSYIFGMLTAVLLNKFAVNPYLKELVGNTFMDMSAGFSVLNAVSVLILFLLIMAVVCRSAAKRSEKIDLTVLLRT